VKGENIGENGEGKGGEVCGCNENVHWMSMVEVRGVFCDDCGV
jgi:hypothetical protein